MTSTLIRCDLVGQTIRGVLQNDWQTQDGISWRDVFVLLSNDFAIQLNNVRDNLKEEPLARACVINLKLAKSDIAATAAP